VKKILIEVEVGGEKGEVCPNLSPEGKRPIIGRKLARSTVRRTTSFIR